MSDETYEETPQQIFDRGYAAGLARGADERERLRIELAGYRERYEYLCNQVAKQMMNTVLPDPIWLKKP